MVKNQYLALIAQEPTKIRSYEEISKDCAALELGELKKLILFARLIPRDIKIGPSTTFHHGLGLKHESLSRMLWLGENHPEEFKKLLPFLILAGSWKDVFVLLRMDFLSNFKLDWLFMFKFIESGLSSDTRDLVLKYLPQVKSSTKCKTDSSIANNHIAKFFCKYAGIDYKQYRLLKASGNEHLWQQIISRGKPSDIDVSTMAKKALLSLNSGKYPTKHHLKEEFLNEVRKVKRVKKSRAFEENMVLMLNQRLMQIAV